MRFSSLFSGVLALAGIAGTSARPTTENNIQARSTAEHLGISRHGILTPNSDTVWTVGQQTTITWNVTEIHNENGTLAAINLYNADEDYPAPIARLATNFQSNTGVYTFTVPEVDNGCYFIKIKSYCGCKIWRSDVFTIQNPAPAPPPPAPPVNPTSPPSHVTTSAAHVTTAPPNPPPTSKAGSGKTTSQPSTPTTVQSSVASSSSSSVPTPPPVAPGILSPNASTVWTIGDNVTITWDVTVVKNENGTLPSIDLYAAGASKPTARLSGTFQSNTGSDNVTVPLVVPGSYFVRINSYNTKTWDSAAFSIRAAATETGILQPNATTVWTVGENVTISWDPTVVKNENGTLKAIELFAVNGTTPITTLVHDFDATTGSIIHQVPNVANGTYYITIDSYRPVAWSSAPFTIQSGPAPPAANPITAPTANSVWVIGENATITWDISQVKNENGTLKAIELYALTSKTPAATLATNFQSNTGSLTVSVPNVTIGSYYIYIESYGSTAWASDHFQILAASPAHPISSSQSIQSAIPTSASGSTSASVSASASVTSVPASASQSASGAPSSQSASGSQSSSAGAPSSSASAAPSSASGSASAAPSSASGAAPSSDSAAPPSSAAPSASASASAPV